LQNTTLTRSGVLFYKGERFGFLCVQCFSAYATTPKASFLEVFTLHKHSDCQRIKACCVLTFIKSAGFYSTALGINYFIPKGILELVVYHLTEIILLTGLAGKIEINKIIYLVIKKGKSYL